jgi:DNA polymerase-3 subunit delta
MPLTSEAHALAALHRNQAAAVYLLVGDDELAKRPLLDALSALVEPDLQPFNLQRIYANERPVEDIVAAARTLPFLGGRRVVIALRCEAFLRTRKKPGAAAAEEGDDVAVAGAESEPVAGATTALERYLERPCADTSLALVAADVARSTRLGKRLLASAVTVEYWGLRGDREARGRDVERALRAAEALVRDKVREAGQRIGPDAIEPLVEHAGTDITVLRNALDRVLTYCVGQAEITRDDVARVVSGATLISAWALPNAIERGNVVQALRQLALQLDEGTAAQQIVGQLRWFVAEQLVRVAPERVAAATEAVLRTDVALKSSGGDQQVLLERLVIELCGSGDGRPRPRQWRQG